MGKLYVARSRELVELVVLGLAVERPRHPYEMLRQVRSRGNTSFLRGLPRSLYHAVDALHDATHLQVEDVSSSDGRPERTVYSATASGHAAFRDRLVHLLRTPTDQATFHAAMSLVAGIDSETVATALEHRAEAIERLLDDERATYDGARSWLPRIVLVEVEYLRSQLEAERDWARSIAAEARSGELSWELRFGTPPTGP